MLQKSSNSKENHSFMNYEELKAECNGKWEGIFQILGIDAGTEKHSPCPHCGGTDRYRFDNLDGNGTYFCSQCGAGNGFELVKKCLGVDYPLAVEKIKGALGMAEHVEPVKKPEYDVKAMLNKIWKASKPLSGSCFVSKYLRSRGLMLTPDNVRACDSCYESDTKEKYNAMVAMVSCADGSPGALHRTYLDGEKKADLKAPRKLTPNIKPLSGGAVRLFPLEYKIFKGDTCGIAEGIETAIAATQLCEVPTWAAIGTSMLKAFVPPEGVKKVVIFGDNDSNFAGQRAAYKLANRLVLENYVVEVEIPEMVGDFNDRLIQLSENQ